MGKNQTGERGKGSQSRNAKKIKKHHKLEDITEALESIGTGESTFILRKHRVHENFKKRFFESIPQKYTPLSHGRVAIEDNESREVVLMAKFTPFTTMEVHELTEIQKLTMALIDLSKRTNMIKGNASHKGGGGQMFALGWRPGFGKDLSFGRYKPSPSTQQSTNKLRKWREDQEKTVAWIGDVYKTRFSTMASKIFGDVLKEAKEAKVPDFSQAEFINLEQKEGVFASNLTYTINDFSNSCHLDNDYNTYTYGIFFPLVGETGELAIISNGSDFECSGGQLIMPTYKVYIDFSKCDGITEVIWRGKKDFHATMKSNCLEGFTRLGSSIQISKQLVFRLWKLIREENTLENAKTKVIGVQQILTEIGEI